MHSSHTTARADGLDRPRLTRHEPTLHSKRHPRRQILLAESSAEQSEKVCGTRRHQHNAKPDANPSPQQPAMTDSTTPIASLMLYAYQVAVSDPGE